MWKTCFIPSWEAINTLQGCDKFWTCDKAIIICVAVHFAEGFCRMKHSNVTILLSSFTTQWSVW